MKQKNYRNKTFKKVKYFVVTFKDPTRPVTHDKHENDKYQKKLHILKLITETVLFSLEQKIAFRGHREQSNYTESYHKK